jgi:DNA-binding NarL/FixJ family response regulator
MFLSPTDRRQLHRASETMLRPFEHAMPIDYLKAIAAEVRPLLGAFAAVSGSRGPDGTVTIGSDDWPAETLEDFARWKLRDAGTERAIAAGLEACSMRRMIDGDWDTYEQDPMVRGWYKPNQVHDAAAYLLHWPEDDALVMVEWHGRTFGTPRLGEEGEWILSMLLPSLKAGTRLLYSLGRHRHRLAADMDALGVAMWVCERDGRVLHQSAAVGRILDGDPESLQVLEAVSLVARGVVRSGERFAADAALASGVHRVIETRVARYRLSAALATHDMHFGVADVLVTLARVPAAPVPPRVGDVTPAMSPREQEVAALLARGARNDVIAATLGISPHTVRRHTERVLAKLGVASRAEVAARLHGLHPALTPTDDERN